MGLIMFGRLKNIESGSSKHPSVRMKFIGITTASHISVYGTENISSDAKIVIVFYFYIWRFRSDDIVQQRKLKRAATRTINYA